MILASRTGGDCGFSLEDIVIFFSGADRIPPLRFPHTPSMSFLECFPTASKCSLFLRLSTWYTTYKSFKNAMKEALFCNGGLDARSVQAHAHPAYGLHVHACKCGACIGYVHLIYTDRGNARSRKLPL